MRFVDTRATRTAQVLAQQARVVLVGAVIGLALEATTAHCQDDLDVAKPLLIYGLGRGADYASTRRAQDFGAIEGHPVTRAMGPAPAALIATVALTGFDLALQKRGHRGLARALRIGATAAAIAAAGNNLLARDKLQKRGAR